MTSTPSYACTTSAQQARQIHWDAWLATWPRVDWMRCWMSPAFRRNVKVGDTITVQLPDMRRSQPLVIRSLRSRVVKGRRLYRMHAVHNDDVHA